MISEKISNFLVKREIPIAHNKITPPQRSDLTFEWNPSEAVHGSRFLTPVYFNRQVLTRYLYDSRFSCEFASETYGTVHGPDFYISFGINKNGSVIAWLGDLQDSIPVRERFYWLVENKAPEGEIASEFYDAQVDAKFTSPPAVIQFLNEISMFNAAFHRKYGVHLYHDRSIEERIEETRRYKRLVLNNADDFKRFISELNEILNENTNNLEIRRLLLDCGHNVASGMKGNKLLQQTYELVLSDSENLIAPFYYLYDLRLWADHSTGEKYIENVAKKLGVTPHEYPLLMEGLISSLSLSAKKLLKKVAA